MNETRILSKFVADARFADLPGEIVQHTKHLVLDHLGTPAKPFTFDEIAERFHKMTAGIISPRSAENIIAAVGNLDKKAADSLEVLTASLRTVDAR